MLLESHTWASHNHHSPWLPGWKRDGGTQGVLAPCLLSTLFPTHPTLSSHEATPEPPPVLTLRNFLCSMKSRAGNVFNPWEWKTEIKHKRKIKCCISERRYLLPNEGICAEPPWRGAEHCCSSSPTLEPAALNSSFIPWKKGIKRLML